MLRRLAIMIVACLALAPLRANAEDVARTVIGMIDLREGSNLRLSNIHSLAEMPLNHLGLVVEYHDILKDLPDLSGRTDIRGVLIWLIDNELPDPKAFFDWAARVSAQGIPIVVMGPMPGTVGPHGQATPFAEINRFLAVLGLRNLGGYRPYTYDLKVVAIDSAMMEFERKFADALQPIDVIQPVDPATSQTFLVLQRGGDSAARTYPVVLTTKGGFAAEGYVVWGEGGEDGARKQWRLNPFSWFAQAFHTDGLPRPDTTTLGGRRIFYSHIDGDGWLNLATVAGYTGRITYASEVVLDEIARRYPDLPLTIAPIGAEIDTEFAGTPRAVSIARAFFALPNVEAASHTYSHPFEWEFFGPSYDVAAELGFAGDYPRVRIDPRVRDVVPKPQPDLKAAYDLPRAYGDIPYDVNHEIAGSIALINRLVAKGREARLIQWSGDTSPAESVLEAVKAAGLLNINGGDTRFDGDWPSYSAVAPVGRRVGRYWQIYSSQANENVYTDLWRGRFFAFRFLETSLRNTGEPIRVKPINIYYHFYSAERQDGLDAVKRNLDYSRTQPIAPITTSHYAEIAEGFYSARFEIAGEQKWRVLDRGAMNTIRFDDATSLGVDFAASSGVIGEARHHDALYVALDPVAEAPVIALKARGDGLPDRPILTESRWFLWNVTAAPGHALMAAQGFGHGDMIWRVAPDTAWEVRFTPPTGETLRFGVVADATGMLAFSLPMGAELEASRIELIQRPQQAALP